MSNLAWIIVEIIVIVAILIPTTIAFMFGAPWVPTQMERVKKMVELSGIKRGERLYELGCGDGRLVHHATQVHGADAVGFELSPIVYWIAKIRQIIWRSNDKIYFRDFRAMDLSDAKAVTFYLLPEPLKILKDKLEKELKIGTRVVSYAFEVKGWIPIHIEPKIPAKNLARIMVYEMGKTHPSAVPTGA